MSAATRVRTGVLLDADGWWVVQQINDERRYYGPPGGGPFASEAEADEACAVAVRVLHSTLAAHNVTATRARVASVDTQP